LGRRGSATRAREGQRVRLNHRRFEEHRSLAPRFPFFHPSRGPDRSRVRSLAPAPSQSFPSPPVVRPAPLERGSGFAFGVRPFAPSAVPLPLEVDPQRSRGPPRAESRAHLHALDVDHLPLDHLQDRRDAILGAPAVRPRTRDQRGDADASAGGDVPGVPLTPRGDDADERGGIGEGGDVEDDLEKERGGGAVARVERGEVGVEPFAAGARRVEVLTRLRSRGEGFFFFNESKSRACFFVRNAAVLARRGVATAATRSSHLHPDAPSRDVVVGRELEVVHARGAGADLLAEGGELLEDALRAAPPAGGHIARRGRTPKGRRTNAADVG